MDVNSYRRLANLKPLQGLVKEEMNIGAAGTPSYDIHGGSDSYEDDGLRVAVFHHGEVPDALSKAIYHIANEVPPEFHDLSSYDAKEGDGCACWADMIVLYGASTSTGLPSKIIELLSSLTDDESESRHAMEGCVVCFVSPVMTGASLAAGQLGAFSQSNGTILVGSSVLFAAKSFDGMAYAAEIAKSTQAFRVRPGRT